MAETIDWNVNGTDLYIKDMVLIIDRRFEIFAEELDIVRLLESNTRIKMYIIVEK